MPRYPERLELRSASWAGPELSYRPPTPYPYMEYKRSRSLSYDTYSTRSRVPTTRYSSVDGARHKYGDDTQRKIDAQNAKIARRPRQSSRHSYYTAQAPKRVRFALPNRRRSYDPADCYAPKRARFALPMRMPTQRKMDERDALAWEFAKLSVRDSASDRRTCSRCGQRL